MNFDIDIFSISVVLKAVVVCDQGILVNKTRISCGVGGIGVMHQPRLRVGGETRD